MVLLIPGAFGSLEIVFQCMNLKCLAKQLVRKSNEGRAACLAGLLCSAAGRGGVGKRAGLINCELLRTQGNKMQYQTASVLSTGQLSSYPGVGVCGNGALPFQPQISDRAILPAGEPVVCLPE